MLTRKWKYKYFKYQTQITKYNDSYLQVRLIYAGDSNVPKWMCVLLFFMTKLHDYSEITVAFKYRAS